jgi:hypothetical protein
MRLGIWHTPLFTILGVVSLVGAALGQANNPHIGVWKANVATSKVSVDAGFKSSMSTFEVVGAGVKITVDAVNLDGTQTHWETVTNYDGKDSPIVGECPYGDTDNMTRVDANTVKAVYKKGGKVLVTQTSVVSSDGKTRTVTIKGTTVKGPAIDNVLFYERQ